MRNKLLLTLLFLSTAANAATTGTVIVNGKVPVVCEIAVVPAGADDGTDGNQDIENISVAANDRDIATVRETCNEFDGYTVTMVGANSGDHTGLFVDSVSSDSHPFSIKYNGASVASTTVTDTSAPVDTATGYVDKLVEISYAADPSLAASDAYTYAETLTFTITAK